MFNMDDVEDLLHVLNICTRLNLWPLQNSFEAQHILRHRATTWGYEESLTALQYMQYTMSEQQSSTNSGPRDATRSIFSPESGSKLSLLFPADKPNRLRRSIHSNVINQFNKLRRPLRMEMIRTFYCISCWEMELRWFAILWNRSFLAFATRFFHDLQALRQRFQRLHLCYLYVPSMLPSQSYACRAFKSAATSRAETGTRPWYRRDLASLDLKKRAGSVCTRNTATDPNLIVIWHICNCQKLFSIGENYNIRLSRYFHLPSLMSLLDFWDFWMIWEFEGLRRDFVGLRRLHFSAPSKPSLHLLDLHFVIVSSQNIGHGTVYARICKDMQGYARICKVCKARFPLQFEVEGGRFREVKLFITRSISSLSMPTWHCR